MGLWDMHTMIHCSLFIFLVGGLAIITYYGYDNQDLASRCTTTTNANIDAQVSDRQTSLKTEPQWGTCDLFSGRWIYDNSSRYPLYEDNQCPYLEETFACQTYGRKDSKYLQWRWQPNGCNFPTFDGKEVVTRLRGKRMLFVGYSLNRNQWMSMTPFINPRGQAVWARTQWYIADLQGHYYVTVKCKPREVHSRYQELPEDTNVNNLHQFPAS